MSVMTKEEFVREVRGYTLHMYRLAYSILNNSTDAEDAVSEAFGYSMIIKSSFKFGQIASDSAS